MSRLAFSSSHLRILAPALREQALLQRAAFHTGRVAAVQPTESRKLGSPSGPYLVKGTVNEATTFPPPSKSHGSYHWTFERAVSAALVPIIAATAVTSANPLLDGVLSLTLIIHSHMGFDQVLIDYVHPRKYPVAGPFAIWALRAATAGVLVGLYQFNTHDIGLTELVKRAWTA